MRAGITGTPCVIKLPIRSPSPAVGVTAHATIIVAKPSTIDSLISMDHAPVHERLCTRAQARTKVAIRNG